MASLDPFVVIKPKGKRLPVLVSVPHCGVRFPEDEIAAFRDEVVAKPEDTDWFVHDLYGFCAETGITLLHAVYSRYIVDLNRDPEGMKLYHDERKETGVVPAATFAGKNIYKQPPTVANYLDRRLSLYFKPYHDEIGRQLQDLRAEFKHVLLWDAHSIKRLVTTIRKEPFPDLILGNQDGKTAAPKVVEVALAELSQTSYEVSHNEPFKGGYITRHWGQPHKGVHALQLEMAQDVYMHEAKVSLDPARVAKVQPVLKRTLVALAKTVTSLP